MSTTSTATADQRGMSRCSSAGRFPTTRRCGSPSEPEAPEHEQRPLARGAGLREHAEGHRGGVDVEERADADQFLLRDLRVDDGVHGQLATGRMDATDLALVRAED